MFLLFVLALQMMTSCNNWGHQDNQDKPKYWINNEYVLKEATDYISWKKRLDIKDTSHC